MPFPDSEGVLHGDVHGLHKASISPGGQLAWVRNKVIGEFMQKSFSFDHDTVGTDEQILHQFPTNALIQPSEVTVAVLDAGSHCGIMKWIWMSGEDPIPLVSHVSAEGEQWTATVQELAATTGGPVMTIGLVKFQFTSAPTPGETTRVGLRIDQAELGI